MRFIERLVFVVITVLFLYKLDYNYFFTDEILYAQRGVEQIRGVFEDTLQVPPLPKYIAGFLHVSFENNVFLIRLPFALIGVLTAYVLHLIVSREFNKWYGFVAAALFSTSRIVFDSTRMVMLEPLMHLFWLVFLYFYYLTFKQSSRKLFIISGVFLGLSLSVKLASLILLVFVLLGFVYSLVVRRTGLRVLTKNYLVMAVTSVGVILIGYIHMFFKIGLVSSVEQTAIAIRNVYIGKSSEGKLHVVGGVVYEKSPWWAYLYYHYNLNGLLRTALYPIFLIIASLRRNFYLLYWCTFFIVSLIFFQLSGVKNIRYVSSMEIAAIPIIISGVVYSVEKFKRVRSLKWVFVFLIVVLIAKHVVYLARLEPTEYFGLWKYFRTQTSNFSDFKRMYVFGSVRSMKWYRDMVPNPDMFIYRKDYEIMCPEFDSFDYIAFDREELLKYPDNLLYAYVRANENNFQQVPAIKDMDVYKRTVAGKTNFECPVAD